MSEDLMLKCLIVFILGWLASRMMGNGFSVGAEWFNCGNINLFPFPAKVIPGC